MAALSPIPTHRALSRCGICGYDDVDVDYLEEFSLLGEDTAVTRVLCECPRCEHRWTARVQAASVLELPRGAGEVPAAA